jgi:hypothetical protein
MKKLLIPAVLLAGLTSAQAVVVVADYTGNPFTTGATEFFLTDDVGGGVTALFTSNAPNSGGVSSFNSASGNGLGIAGGANNTWFDQASDGGAQESFALTIQLYTGYVDPTNRGTNVTGDYTILLTGATSRQRDGGTFGLAFSGGATVTDTVDVGGAATANAAPVAYDLSNTPVTANTPITVTASSVTSGSRIFQLQTVSFNVVPEPSSAALFGLASLSLLRRRRR